jgi:hypothetical protein
VKELVGIPLQVRAVGLLLLGYAQDPSRVEKNMVRVMKNNFSRREKNYLFGIK